MSKGKKFSFSNLDKIPETPGAYAIHMMKPIARFLGTDPDGILDIGEADNLQDRLRSFEACAEGRRKKGHSAGVRYRRLGLSRIAPLEALQITVHETDNKSNAYKKEGRLLAAYLELYKELPPLNYKFNNAGREP